VTLSSGVSCVPAAREHFPFVLDSFRLSLADTAHVYPVTPHVTMLERMIRGGLGRVVVATPRGHADTYLGWAAEEHGRLVFAYVPQLGHLRRLGIARQMLAELFSDGPVRLIYWTLAAERIRRHGFPIVHDWQEFSRRQRLAERVSRRPAQPNERTA
jgi:hypothetical protein